LKNHSNPNYFGDTDFSPPQFEIEKARQNEGRHCHTRAADKRHEITEIRQQTSQSNWKEKNESTDNESINFS
jgi:hypothetical protein